MSLVQKEKKGVVILVALIFFQLVLISIQVPLEGENYFEKFIFSVFSPLEDGFVFVFDQIANFWKNYFYLRNVMDQNKTLEKEMFFLRQENNILRHALQEYKKKKEIKSRIAKIKDNIIVARVVGLDISRFYKSIIINKGHHDGLKKDMVVVDRLGNLVGRVVEPITFRESRVQLITDTASGVGVISQRKKIPGILTGDGQGRCQLKYIISSKRFDIVPGEMLITSGYDGIFPRGLRVGNIISVTRTTSLFKKIKVHPFFDFSDLDQVAVFLANPADAF
ncbi:MAG: rod shape-determining protein MreC [Candidatus Aminicenantales bacterium]